MKIVDKLIENYILECYKAINELEASLIDADKVIEEYREKVQEQTKIILELKEGK